MTTTARLAGQVALLVLLALMLLAAPAMAFEATDEVAIPTETPEPEPTPQVTPAADDLAIDPPCYEDSCAPIPPPPPTEECTPQTCLAPNPSEDPTVDPTEPGGEFPVPNRVDAGGGGTQATTLLVWAGLATLAATALGGTAYALRSRR